MTTRNALRRTLRDKRRSLDAAVRARLSGAACARLRAHRVFRQARHVACYLPFDGEMDLTGLFDAAARMRKTLYLPVLRPGRRARLWFVPWRPGDPLARNRYGIAEPAAGPAGPLPPWALDLAIVPLVGVDARGNRLGMGAGYYDNTFAYLLRREHWRTPRLLGAAFAMQQVERIAPHARDVPLDGLVTEDGVTFF